MEWNLFIIVKPFFSYLFLVQHISCDTYLYNTKFPPIETALENSMKNICYSLCSNYNVYFHLVLLLPPLPPFNHQPSPPLTVKMRYISEFESVLTPMPLPAESTCRSFNSSNNNMELIPIHFNSLLSVVSQFCRFWELVSILISLSSWKIIILNLDMLWIYVEWASLQIFWTTLRN